MPKGLWRKTARRRPEAGPNPGGPKPATSGVVFVRQNGKKETLRYCIRELMSLGRHFGRIWVQKGPWRRAGRRRPDARRTPGGSLPATSGVAFVRQNGKKETLRYRIRELMSLGRHFGEI